MSEPGAPTIVLEDVSRWYGNVVAVNGMSFTVGPGITGLLGPNGAGKSTLLHMLSGFLAPSAGTVTVLGEPAWKNPALYRRLGLVPERESVYGSLTGFEFVLLNARLQGVPNADEASREAIRLVDLEEAAGRATGGYSKGMKQRIKVAAALVHNPDVLLLDEPFNGADPATAAAHDRPLPPTRRRGSNAHLLLAHPRGGRAACRARPRDRRWTTRRVGRLPGDPTSDDRSAAHLHAANE